MLEPKAAQIAEGYALGAYCKWRNADHGFREFPHTFYGPDRADARRRGEDVCPRGGRLAGVAWGDLRNWLHAGPGETGVRRGLWRDSRGLEAMTDMKISDGQAAPKGM